MPADCPPTPIAALKAVHADLQRLALITQATLAAMEVARSPDMALSLKTLRELADVSEKNLRVLVNRVCTCREFARRAVRDLEPAQREATDD